MLAVPGGDRWVLFGTAADDLYSYRVVHVTGSAKLVEIPVDEKLVPNFYLTASMVADLQIYQDAKQVVVPPTKNFLTVDVKSDKEQYQPREEGTLTVTARDDQGRPVAAEILATTKAKLELFHAKNAVVKPDRETREMAEVAATNGSVYGRGRTADGLPVEDSTKARPMLRYEYVNTEVETVADVLQRSAA
mgnify:CR=1 FL=1